MICTELEKDRFISFLLLEKNMDYNISLAYYELLAEYSRDLGILPFKSYEDIVSKIKIRKVDGSPENNTLIKNKNYLLYTIK